MTRASSRTGSACSWVPGVVKARAHTDTFNGVLCIAFDYLRRFDTHDIEDRRHDVDGMVVLVAHLATTLDPFRPGDQQRVADATVVGIALPHLERRIERHRPAIGIMVVFQWAAQHIQVLEVLLQAIWDAIHKLALVDRAGGTTLTTGAIIGDYYHEGIVELT